MSTSAWANVSDDTIQRVTRITPTVSSGLKWRHIPASRADNASIQGGSGFRTFMTETEPEEQLPFSGAALRKVSWRLVLVAHYPTSDDLRDIVGADHKDLIEALHPTATYNSGTWGALCIRKVEEPEEITRDGQTVEVRYPVRHVFRQPVTLV